MNRLRRCVAALGVAVLSVGFVVETQAQKIGAGDRTLTIDSRYFAPEYSNRALTQFGIDLIGIASLPGALLLPVDTTPGGTGEKFLFYRSSQWKNLGNGFITLVGSIFLRYTSIV